ncbi:MAG: hypothetical protein ACI9FO_001502 [Methylophagaceae bacterium]
MKDKPTLFKGIIPIAFHVDYWDQLGWEDRWAQAGFSNRQRQLKRQKLLSQVYTPGVVVMSQEWRDWDTRPQPPTVKPIKTSVLSAQLNGQQLAVNYSEQGDYVLNIA